MEIESLAAALKRGGIAKSTTASLAYCALPGDARPLARAIWALRRHIYLGGGVPVPAPLPD